MDDEIGQPGAGGEPGFFDSLRAVINDFTALLHTRLELASTEFEEEMERLKQTLLLGAISLVSIALGMVLLTFFIVVVFWDTHRLLVLGGLAAFYMAVGVIAALVAKNKAAAIPKFLSVTIAEFGKDRERMSQL